WRRPQMMVERAADRVFGLLARQVEMRDLRERVHPGIGATGAVHNHALAAEFCDRVFERGLHRYPCGLALPADEAGAVVLDRQLVAGHGSTRPGGTANPRRKASASCAARPARWRRSGRN